MSLLIKVAKLWGSPEGTTQKVSLDAPLSYDPKEIDATSNLQGDLLLIKLKDEISALVTDATLSVRFACNRCLKPFIQEIEVPEAERQFLHRPPAKADDMDDIYLIDPNGMTIDLTEMMRQEIILHFPLVSVCSKSCKGLCQYCGKDRNKTLCHCQQTKEREEPGTHKPFKNLKGLLKNS